MSTIALYLTESEDCSYLSGYRQRMLVVDPLQEIEISIATQLSRKGFRRSGNMIYQPNCQACNKCVSLRIPVEAFKASKSQKRVIAKNKHLRRKIVSLQEADRYFPTYLSYQQARHPNGIMCNPDIELYRSFIESDVANSYFMVLESTEPETVNSVTVIDVFLDGLSAVYTFFDPTFSGQSLGTNAVLELVNLAKERNLDYVYLGFWIDECSKMNYKTKFKPVEGFVNNQWLPID